MYPKPATGGSGPDRTRDQLFRVLEDDFRRRVIDHMIGRTEPIRLHALAACLVADASRTSADGDSSDPDDLGIVLHHVHLPKLSAAGLVDYDPARRTVGACDDIERVEPFLEMFRRISAKR